MTDLSYSIKGKSVSEIACYLGMHDLEVLDAITNGASTYNDVYYYKSNPKNVIEQKMTPKDEIEQRVIPPTKNKKKRKQYRPKGAFGFLKNEVY